MGLIDSYRRTLELTEIEERLQTLENAYMSGSMCCIVRTELASGKISMSL